MVKSAETTKPAIPKKIADQATSSITSNQAMESFRVPFIVGIGASAGGLDPIERFLKSVPVDLGAAYVIVQHLDPTHKGILPELLQRVTSMIVCQAKHRMPIKPNCVYVIPPNKDLSISKGSLHLSDPVHPRGLRLPIDFLFKSMAEDLGSHAIGVVLSGMGSDGTLGLKAIKENGGLSLAQHPSTAQFEGMPRSAIDAGMVDMTSTVEELPVKIIQYVKNDQARTTDLHAAVEGPDDELSQIVTLLRDQTGNDFSLYKPNTMYRRIERRMGLYQFGTLNQYIEYLRKNPQEIELLFKELLIGVTSFFRDPVVWEFLKSTALPALLEQYPANGKIIRAWVPACSSGGEAYSLAIVFQEVIEQIKPKRKLLLQIFATDLDPDAINAARQGFYPDSIASAVSPERLHRFFVKEEGGYRIVKGIREKVIFATQNIIMDPPFTKLDIITCRNMLIYFGKELQKKLLPLFHYALNRNGLLLLGNAETAGDFTELFTLLDNKARLYRRLDGASRLGLHFPTKNLTPIHTVSTEPKTEKIIGNLQHQADQILLQNFSPAAVLINAEGDVLYINGRTGDYLEPAAGKANWNIYAMARDGLRSELPNALKTAIKKQIPVYVANLQVTGNQGITKTFNLTVYPVGPHELLHGMLMLVFSDCPPELDLKTTLKKPNDRAAVQMTEMKRVRDDMQVMQEELTSANEELQSTNEELQSTNEELTTSKEEMQSMNEELQSVNAELQSKIDDLMLVNSDMKNLLNSTEIAMIFLDGKYNVRRFTTPATQIFKLLGNDVGRSLFDIVCDLHYPELQDDADEVLQSLVFSEKQVPTADGRWYRVRIMPYRTLDNVIDGVVITMSDITEMKLLENELRRLAKE
jgi:two-component system CheB/CheR fusion protein